MNRKTTHSVRGWMRLALLAVIGLWPLGAQTPAPSGTYGFLANIYEMEQAGWTGGAVIGVLKIDEAGNVTGAGTFQGRDSVNPSQQVGPVNFTGTYTVIYYGVGVLEMIFEDGYKAVFAVVTTDGGQTLQFTTFATGAGNPALRGGPQPLTLTGGVPAYLLFPQLRDVTGGISLVVRRGSPNANVFTGSGATAGGTATCPDGSAGEWTASVENVTIAASTAGDNGAMAGNFLLSANTKSCGEEGWKTLSGLTTGSFLPSGSVLLLRNFGSFIRGTAKAIRGVSLAGTYGLQSDFWPYPGGLLANITFDGVDGVSATFINGNANGEFTAADRTGKYKINDDGSGTIDLNTPTGEPGGPSYSIVVVDNGSSFLFLRTKANPQFSVSFGLARLQ
jgi:hypothetical protein